jgi:Tol biopolymer transport system component
MAMRTLWPEGAWPCFAPDGRHIVFTAGSRLMLIALDGDEEPRALTPADVDAKRPTWLPGTSEIAFNRGGSIWTVDAASGRLAPFSADPRPFFHPCAYPKGRAVVVVSMYDGPQGREGVLFRLTPESAEPLTKYPEVCAGRPGVSPDGKTVVFAGNAGACDQGANQLWLVAPGESPRRLEEGDPVRTQGRAPRWSPDGKWIACTSTRPAPEPTEATPKAVWIISADGNEKDRLTDYDFDPLQVDWSPDQTRLVCGGFDCPLAILELPERFR